MSEFSTLICPLTKRDPKSCCFFTTGLLAQVEYDVDVELNLTDIGTVDALRSILDAGGFSLALGPTVNVTHINITRGKHGGKSMGGKCC